MSNGEILFFINSLQSTALMNIDECFLFLLAFWNCNHEIQYTPMDIRKKVGTLFIKIVEFHFSLNFISDLWSRPERGFWILD